MSRLPRPPIPLAVKLRVALRQLGGYRDCDVDLIVVDAAKERKLGSVLNTVVLVVLARKLSCAVADLALDHDPALVNREKLIELASGRRIKAIVVPKGGKILRYFPDANDSDHLRYRPKPTDADHSHDIKTRVRGDHGQLSDLALARKEKRRVKKLARKKAPKRKRQYRWPKGRKLPSRPMRGRR